MQHGHDEQPEEECTLLSSNFGNVIQIFLGILALGVLFFKRYMEKPRRALTIWFMDASKQAIGALVAHLVNLAIAIFLYKQQNHVNMSHSVDQCAFYFVNFAVDTTLGVALNYLFLSSMTCVAKHYGWTYLVSVGDYGKKLGSMQFIIWLTQLSSWVLVILLTKAILSLGIFILLIPLGKIAEWLFHPLDNYPKTELVIVMVMGPCLMNAGQFWIQDSFLKKKIKEKTSVEKSCDEESPILSSSCSPNLKSDTSKKKCDEKRAILSSSCSPDMRSETSKDEDMDDGIELQII